MSQTAQFEAQHNYIPHVGIHRFVANGSTSILKKHPKTAKLNNDVRRGRGRPKGSTNKNKKMKLAQRAVMLGYSLDGDLDMIAQMPREIFEKPGKVIPLTFDEEVQLLHKLYSLQNAPQDDDEFAIRRLRRKLFLREFQRQNSIPRFDLDIKVHSLQKSIHKSDQKLVNYFPKNYIVSASNFSENSNNFTPIFGGFISPLDRTSTMKRKVDTQPIVISLLDEDILPNENETQSFPSSFTQTNLTQTTTTVQTSVPAIPLPPAMFSVRLGIDECENDPIISPYTLRTLKPFIRRDYESCPPRVSLHRELMSIFHKDEEWKQSPIDFVYLRPSLLNQVNRFLCDNFWQGIDVRECLAYPDHTVCVLYKKLVIGCGFMTPDAYIIYVAVHPQWRRCGIASFMLYHLIHTNRGKDVTLHVSATNSAMLLYQKFGFKPEEYILEFYNKYYPEDSKECKHSYLLRLRR